MTNANARLTATAVLNKLKVARLLLRDLITLVEQMPRNTATGKDRPLWNARQTIDAAIAAGIEPAAWNEEAKT